MVSGCLPMDVLLDVLLRLPIKSLKRFECVSKSWKSLIRDPNFSKQHIEHMNKSSSTIKTKNHNFIVSYMPFVRDGTYLSLLNLDENTGSIVSFRWLNLRNYFKVGEYMKLIGPVNGIYCVYSRDYTKIAMVNIALRELKVVPPLLLPSSSQDFMVVGFGFDHETNDYKVVVFNEFFSEGWIYSLRCDSWKDVDCSTVPEILNLPFRTVGLCTNCNNCLDGKVHWLRTDKGTGCKFVLYFDLVAEVFGQIDLPESIRRPYKVAVWKECLAVITDADECCDIWIMQDLGNKVEYSWTKFPVETSSRVGELVEGFWRNDEILFRGFDYSYGGRFDIFSYDPSTKKGSKLFDAQLCMERTLVYSESLVSVIGDERDERNMFFDVVDDHDIVDINQIRRKIYVRGLTRETTQAQLIEHFRKFGKITNSIIMKDHTSGQSRGFGFVTFANSCAVDEVYLHELIFGRTHMINGKKLEVKQAIPRGLMGFKGKRKEILVSGIPRTVREDEFKDFFSQFGEVKDHMISGESTSRLCFGYITFHTEEAVGYLLGLGNKLHFAGVQVEIKRAE